MTAENPLHPKRQSSDYTTALDCFIRVLTTGWRKSARLISEKEKLEYPRIKRKVALVETNKGKEKAFHGIYPRHSLAKEVSVL